jgi:hypothetical protein
MWVENVTMSSDSPARFGHLRWTRMGTAIPQNVRSDGPVSPGDVFETKIEGLNSQASSGLTSCGSPRFAAGSFSPTYI